jgi:ankyrin repeat protein
MNANRDRFLLASLYLETLSSKHNIAAVRKSLVDLPRDLNKVYEDALHRIKSQSEDDQLLAIKTLTWMSYAQEAVKVDLLRLAMATEDATSFFGEDDLINEDIIIDVCCGLVAIDKQSKIIRLVHYTAREYFEQKQIRKQILPNGHTFLARVCLKHLCFVYKSDNLRYKPWYSSLATYSNKHWWYHASGDVENEVLAEILLFLKLCSPDRYLMDLGIRQIIKYSLLETTKAIITDKLGEGYREHLLEEACGFDSLPILKMFLVIGANVPLRRYGGVSTIDVIMKDISRFTRRPLVAYCADQGLYGVGPLHHSVGCGLIDKIKSLVTQGASTSAKDYAGRTPLQYALRQYFYEIKQLPCEMLSKDNTVRRTRCCPFHNVLFDNNSSQMHSFLQPARNRNASVGQKQECNKPDTDEGSDLMLPEVCSTDMGGRSLQDKNPLQFAIRGKEIVEQLVRNHYDIDARSHAGNSASSSTICGEIDLIEILTSGGADININWLKGKTALHYAVELSSREDIVQQLVSHGADVNIVLSDGRTLLHYAIQCRSKKLARIFINSGVDIDAKCCRGLRAIQYAVGLFSMTDIAEQLVSRGADVTAVWPDDTGRTILHYAAQQGFLELALIAINSGVDIDAKCHGGLTALHIATLERKEDMKKMLMEAGADEYALTDDGFFARDLKKQQERKWYIRKIPISDYDNVPMLIMTTSKRNKCGNRTPSMYILQGTFMQALFAE